MRLIIFIFFLGCSTFLFAQIHHPVRRDTSIKKDSKNSYLLTAIATIQKGWHTYSLQVPKNGPLPTVFSFNKNNNYQCIGSITESKGHMAYDPVFDMVITYFENRAVFSQRVYTETPPKVITAEIEYMACNNKECLPPQYEDLTFYLSHPVNLKNTEQSARSDEILISISSKDKEYQQGIAYAKKTNKPILLDFTGWACVNCRKMEQNIWTTSNILSLLKNEVALISLYVDDKRPFKNGERVPSKLYPGKTLRYRGQKWSELQAIRYKTNSQPFYVLMDHQEKKLNPPIGYTPDPKIYYQLLQEGIQNFE
ncbi:protein-disulfide reductase DsbD domain-containing protein [Aquimarina hainanensis]|uniref:Protein-disulfide reductase DsbD domain-containing protein n=1 Tax=Aquimarina hainanensis TaxID=1578017 RepID=A0ABW5NA84_9FLAO